MARASVIQSNFIGGEFSPLLRARVDLDRYKTGVATLQNYIPIKQGGFTRRPGTFFVGPSKSNGYIRLVEFQFSITQAYVIEVGDRYFRFYANQGQLVSGGTPVEVVTPYLLADIDGLRFVQSADVLYIVHPNYPPATLNRTSSTSFTLTTISFTNGPYLDANNTSITLNPSGVSGSVTVTASAGIFLSTDVGGLIRIFHTTWGWGIITAYTSATVVTVSVKAAFGATGAVTTWQLGAWSNSNGWPSFAVFHEDRLWFCGAEGRPEGVDGSNVGSYTDFSPSDATGSVKDTNAVDVTVNTQDVQRIMSMASTERGILLFTASGEQLLRPADPTVGGITPTNVAVQQQSAYGSGSVAPVVAGPAVLYLQRSGRKVRECLYTFASQKFDSADLTELAEHMTYGDGFAGIKDMKFQKESQPILWCVRNDGALVGLTYERDTQSLRAGWHYHQLGGFSTAGGYHAYVESLAVIPSSFGAYYEVWLSVLRYINGGLVRYIEYLTDIFQPGYYSESAFFVDCGLQTGYFAISAVTQANPAVVTTTVAHGFTNGDQVYLADVIGMTELNRKIYTVAGVASTTFQLQGIDSTTYGAYAFSGRVAKRFSSLSGLNHLEGQPVDILGDGAAMTATVSSGSISLPSPAGFVAAGLHYNSDVQLLRSDAGGADGTAIGKTRRTHNVEIVVNETMSLKCGMSFTGKLDLILKRNARDPMSSGPPLFTGIVGCRPASTPDLDNMLCIRQDQPFPGTILAVVQQLETQDRG